MGQIAIRKRCKDCDQMRPFQKQGTSHLLHVLLCLFTVGLWLPVWIVVGALNVFTPFRCSVCGKAHY